LAIAEQLGPHATIVTVTRDTGMTLANLEGQIGVQLLDRSAR